MRPIQTYIVATLALFIAICSYAGSSPVTETGLALLRKDEAGATTDLALAKDSPWNGTTDVLQARISDAVVIELIKIVPQIVDKVCANPYVCALAITAALLAFYFYVYAPNDYQHGSGVVPTRRDIKNIQDSFDLHPVLQVHDRHCNLDCRLKRFSVEGEWTHIGQARSQGRLHNLYHFYNGTTRGIRAAGLDEEPFTIKRESTDQQQTEDMIGDYYWESSSEAAYNSFHSNQQIIQNAASTVTNFLKEENGIEACVVFVDSTGPLANGLYTLGWNGKPYEFSSQSALDADLGTCYYENLLNGPSRGPFLYKPVDS